MSSVYDNVYMLKPMGQKSRIYAVIMNLNNGNIIEYKKKHKDCLEKQRR